MTTSVYLTGALGIFPGLDAMLQLPVHRLSFEDAAAKREKTGFGDPRMYLRVSGELFGVEGIPLALRGGSSFRDPTFPWTRKSCPSPRGSATGS